MTPESPSLRFPSTSLRITVLAAGIAATLITGPAGKAAATEPAPEWDEAGTVVRIARAIDGERLLTDDGREIRLQAIAMPKISPPRHNQPLRTDRGLEALQASARERLAAASETRRLRLHFDRVREDRHGRLLAQVVSEDGTWLQAHLVASGLARVETTADGATHASSLLALEARARAAKSGMWNHRDFAILSPRDAGRRLDTFQLVEGMAQALEGRRPTTRFALMRDGVPLTVAFSPAVRSEWRRANTDVRAWLGRPLRVRGWIRWQDGAVIDVTHLAQIEFVDPLTQ